MPGRLSLVSRGVGDQKARPSRSAVNRRIKPSAAAGGKKRVGKERLAAKRFLVRTAIGPVSANAFVRPRSGELLGAHF